MHKNERGGMQIKRLKTLTGAYAVAEAFRQINPEVVPVYPITPQSPIAESFAKFKADGKVDTELVLAESEHSVMSIAIGASAAGVRAITASASQGLALMWELLPAASGLRLPIIMAVANRALSAPINIHCDHSDSMGAKDQGWIQMYAENAQEAYEMIFLALKLAEKVELPAMVMQDGFITSHAVEAVKLLDDSKAKRFVGKRKVRHSLLNFASPVTFGPLLLQNSYFESKLKQEEAMQKAKKDYIAIGQSLSKLTRNNYGYFEKYKTNDAKAIIVTLASTAGNVKAVVDRMRKKGKKVGLLRIRLFRPFPYEQVAKALEKAKAVGILDRSISFGANAPLFSEILQSLQGVKNSPKMKSCIFGLGGRDIFEEQIEEVFRDLLAGRFHKVSYIK